MWRLYFHVKPSNLQSFKIMKTNQSSRRKPSSEEEKREPRRCSRETPQCSGSAAAVLTNSRVKLRF